MDQPHHQPHVQLVSSRTPKLNLVLVGMGALAGEQAGEQALVGLGALVAA